METHTWVQLHFTHGAVAFLHGGDTDMVQLHFYMGAAAFLNGGDTDKGAAAF